MVTMVEPTRDPALLAEYNRWYEEDHCYSGVLMGPGAFAYRRWVATRPLKDLRFPAASTVADPVDTGSFIAAYWYAAGTVEDHFAWSFAGLPTLVEQGRMNPDRTHVSTSLYDVVGVVTRPGWTVAPQIALHHPYAAMVALWTDRAESSSTEQLAQALTQQVLPGATTEGSPIAQAITLAPRDMPGAPGSGVGVGQKLLTLLFLQRDPREVWTSAVEPLGEAVAATGHGTVGLAAGFIPVVPGTDTYLDQLW
jgi:hypothetical protein